MDRNEAVLKLIKVARISEAYAKDLYDSFFEKPVVPQYVADWYEEHKDDCDYELWDYFSNWDDQEDDDFKNWVKKETEPIIAIVNMHQFGYEVEKEKRYRVSMPKTRNRKDHAQLLCEANGKVFWCGEWYRLRTKFTRKELEEADFGWVFNCPGVEVTEVTDGND